MIDDCRISYTLLSRGVRSLFGPTRKSSPWGNFSDGGLNQSIKRRLSLQAFGLIGLLNSYRTICFYGGGAKVTEHRGTKQYIIVQFNSNLLRLPHRRRTEQSDWPPKNLQNPENPVNGRRCDWLIDWLIFRVASFSRGLFVKSASSTVKSRWIKTLWQGSRKFWPSAGRKSCRAALCGG